MRTYPLLACTSLLAACGGGGGTQEISSAPPPPSGSTATHSFVAPTEAKTYVGIGGSQVYQYLTDDRECCDQQGQTYAGNATTVRDSGVSITYDPRDAIFTLTVQDAKSGANTRTRFQDPGSRTDFGGAHEPQWGTPRLTNGNIAYLQAGDGNPRAPYEMSGTGTIDAGDNDTPPYGSPGSAYQATSFFYLKPGAETKYVTFAGYARNAYTFVENDIGGRLTEVINHTLERGAFAYGELTDSKAVPVIGSGTYRGSMLASMVFNPTLDGQDVGGSTVLPSYFQWIEGSATLNVDFAKSLFDFALTGSVLAPQLDYFTDPQRAVIAAGATFSASGKGNINLVNFGGFKGQMDAAAFVNPDGTRREVTIAGSSIDGGFYGPKADEVGGGFRIVGGKPDERIDILGAFVGTK